MKVGDLVLLKKEFRVDNIDYGVGIVLSIEEYPFENFTSHKVRWKDDFSFHGQHELEIIQEI